jgi:hypothetical protein
MRPFFPLMALMETDFDLVLLRPMETAPCMSQTPSPSPHNAIATDIEKLHLADVAATLARDVEALTALWDPDAVLLQPGQPAVAGKLAFREFIKQRFAKSSSNKVLKYVPDIKTCKSRRRPEHAAHRCAILHTARALRVFLAGYQGAHDLLRRAEPCEMRAIGTEIPHLN